MDNRFRTVFTCLRLSIPALGFAQPEVNLTTTKGDAAEAGQVAGTIQVSIESSLVSQLTVYMQRTGTADRGIDFTTSGMIYHGGDLWSMNILSNQLTASGTITPVYDQIIEGDENLVFTLEGEETRFFTGKPDVAAITIKDLVEIVFKDGFEDP